MSELGKIGWIDLTIDDATVIREFYEQVTGWTSSGVDMDGYQDYCMHPNETADPVAGICHRRGPNSEIPPQWMIYINVSDLDESIEKCKTLGGKVICGKRSFGGYGSTCVIQDPAGAVAALFEPKS